MRKKTIIRSILKDSIRGAGLGLALGCVFLAIGVARAFRARASELTLPGLGRLAVFYLAGFAIGGIVVGLGSFLRSTRIGAVLLGVLAFLPIGFAYGLYAGSGFGLSGDDWFAGVVGSLLFGPIFGLTLLYHRPSTRADEASLPVRLRTVRPPVESNPPTA